MKEGLRYGFVLTFVMLATSLAYLLNGKSLMGVDDANIYFVYMKNLADGHGFVYNIGGERVEGFTSLLWTLIGGLCFFITTRPEWLLLAFNIITVSFALWKVLEYIHSQSEENKWIISAPMLLLLGLLVCIPGYFEWTVLSLMETGLWSTLLIITTLHILHWEQNHGKFKKQLVFCSLIVLQVLCRPESMLWVLFFITLLGIQLLLAGKTFKNVVIDCMPGVLIYVLTLFTLVTWRKIYFGFPFPNTYYAKVSADKMDNIIAGAKYLFEVVENNPLIILIIPVTLNYLTLKISSLKNNIQPLTLLAIVALALTIPFYTGGDHFALSRFFQPIAPLFYTVLIMFCLKKEWHLRFEHVLLVLLFTFFVPRESVPRSIKNQETAMTYEWTVAIKMQERSKKLNVLFEDLNKYPIQGVLAAGGSAYVYQGPTNDLLGLNNVEMAHSKKVKNPESLKNHASFDKDVFFKQKPDIFFYGRSQIVQNSDTQNMKYLEINDFQNQVFQNIVADERFEEAYDCVIISNNKLNYSLKVFASEQFLDVLRKQKDFKLTSIPILKV